MDIAYGGWAQIGRGLNERGLLPLEGGGRSLQGRRKEGVGHMGEWGGGGGCSFIHLLNDVIGKKSEQLEALY